MRVWNNVKPLMCKASTITKQISQHRPFKFCNVWLKHNTNQSSEWQVTVPALHLLKKKFHLPDVLRSSFGFRYSWYSRIPSLSFNSTISGHQNSVQSINPNKQAPFGTINTPGDVNIMLHTLLCLSVAHS